MRWVSSDAGYADWEHVAIEAPVRYDQEYRDAACFAGLGFAAFVLAMSRRSVSCGVAAAWKDWDSMAGYSQRSA